MKKLIIGCAVVVVLAGVAGTIAVYWVFNKVRTTVSEYTELAEAAKLNDEVTNKAPFTPPASGELTTASLDRFMQVQGDIRAALGVRFKEFEQRYEGFIKSMQGKDSPTTPGEVMQMVSAYRDLGLILLQAKKAQVAALNRAAFSVDEYNWVREHVYNALGVPSYSFNLSEMIDAIQKGTQPHDPRGNLAGPLTASDAEKQLVAPHEKMLMDNYPLVIFGL